MTNLRKTWTCPCGCFRIEMSTTSETDEISIDGARIDGEYLDPKALPLKIRQQAKSDTEADWEVVE